MSEYVLGTSEHELERLRFQNTVWGPVTERFLDRVGVPAGARVLDVGTGPGFALAALRERVGEGGSITALDAAEDWTRHLEGELEARGWNNVILQRGDVRECDLESEGYDFIFMRWVLSFLPDPAALIQRLAGCLAPGGRLAIQDYNHEGLSLFPESAGFVSVVQATRDYVAGEGGDLWVASRLPGYMRSAGLELVDYTPNVLCGGPDSPAFQWAHRFFPYHVARMVEAGVLSEADRSLFDREWRERREDPDAVFFSPIVMDCAGKRAD